MWFVVEMISNISMLEFVRVLKSSVNVEEV